MAEEARLVKDAMSAEELLSAARALTQGETDTIANMANLASLVWHGLEGLNWAGFYRLQGDQLVLGPFQGKPACLRIPAGKGVCGKALSTGQSQRVGDVQQFPGHIACDPASRSELVVLVKKGDDILGVLDLDSPRQNRFTPEDEALMEQLAGLVQGS